MPPSDLPCGHTFQLTFCPPTTCTRPKGHEGKHGNEQGMEWWEIDPPVTVEPIPLDDEQEHVRGMTEHERRCLGCLTLLPDEEHHRSDLCGVCDHAHRMGVTAERARIYTEYGTHLAAAAGCLALSYPETAEALRQMRRALSPLGEQPDKGRKS